MKHLLMLLCSACLLSFSTFAAQQSKLRITNTTDCDILVIAHAICDDNGCTPCDAVINVPANSSLVFPGTGSWSGTPPSAWGWWWLDISNACAVSVNPTGPSGFPCDVISIGSTNVLCQPPVYMMAGTFEHCVTCNACRIGTIVSAQISLVGIDWDLKIF